MASHDVKGISAYLNRMVKEAPEVFSAIESIREQISKGINNFQIRHGSHVNTVMLNSLNADQRQRVLQNLIGRYFENQKHDQFKVVAGSGPDSIKVIAEQIDSPHFCTLNQ